MITPHDIQVIKFVADHDTVTRAQITRELFPDDKDGRITRRRLKVIRDAGLVNQTNMLVVNPVVNCGIGGPVYYSSADGVEYLAQELEDDRYKRVNTTTPHHLYLHHFVAVAQTHITLGHAAPKAGASVVEWIGERALRDPQAKEPEHRYRLYQLVSQAPRVTCAADAGFLLDDGKGARKVFFLELDRHTTMGADRVASQKTPGFAGVWEKKLHLRLFPTANVEKFTVLVIAPTAKRINALRKAFSTKADSWLYKFASLEELNEDTFLTGKVWHTCTGETGSLLKGVSG